jgi:uncharacterized protein
MAERRIPPPRIDPEMKPFWDAAAQGKLFLKRCRQCGAAHWHPRLLCPFCLGATEWFEASGRGEIYSMSVTRRGEIYAIAYVTLEEGVTMLTNIVDCDYDALRIGQKVRVKFVPSDGGAPVPMFTLG